MLSLSPARIVAVVACLVAPASAFADTTDACIASAEHAQTLRKAGHLREAHAELVTCAGDACPDAVASDCKRWLGEVEASTPSIVVRAIDGAAHDLADVTLTIDGARVADHLDGRAVSIDPGEHTIQCARAGDMRATHVLVREGEHDRVVTIPFAAPPAPLAAVAHARVPALAWTLIGAGVVAMGTGALLWVDGVNERDDLRASCGVTRACSASDEQPAKTKLLVGDVAFGAGLVTLAAGVWLGVTASPRVDIVAVRGGAVASYGVTF